MVAALYFKGNIAAARCFLNSPHDIRQMLCKLQADRAKRKVKVYSRMGRTQADFADSIDLLQSA
jgi:hypothetical protein